MTRSTNRNNTVLNRLARAIVQLRFAILLLFAVLLLAAGFYLPQFRINASADTLLVKNNALYIKTQQANQRFSPDEFILLAYQPHNGDIYSAATFSDLQLLAGQYRQLPRVSRVSSILTVPLLSDASALIGDSDISALNWQQQQYPAEQMQQLLKDHPLYTDLLLNKAQTAVAIQIVFKAEPELAAIEQQMLQLQSHTLQRELTDAEQERLAQLQQQADPLRQALSQQRQQEIQQINRINQQVADRAKTYMGGAYVVGQHLVTIIKNDLSKFGVAIALIIALLLLLLYRRLRWVVFPLLACAVSVWLTLGLFAALNLRATVISANFIALQLILTLAVMIHLITSYRDIARETPEATQQQRVIATLQQKLAPCFYATLTTSVGFASLLFSGIQPVVDFGLMMLLAMLVTMSVSLLLFPALLCLLSAKTESADYAILQQLLAAIRLRVAGAPLRTVVISAALFLLLCPGLLRLNVENSFINYFAADTRVHQELRFIDQHFGGSTPLDIIIDAKSSAASPDLLLTALQVNQLHTVHAAVEAFEATGNVTSVLNFTRLARQLNDDKPLTEYELNSIYQLLDKQVAAQLVGAYLVQQPLQLRIASRIQDTTAGLDREQLLRQLRQDLQSLGLSQQDYSLTNLFVLYQDILSRLLDSQVNTLGLVYLTLALILLLIFRSVKIAMIALLPNILTTLGIVGLIGWLGIPLDLMTITIAAIAMGIAIDDTIHFTHRYLQAPAGKALQDSYAHTGLAMLFTSGIIAVGFAVFALSDFLPSVYFGLLTAAAMLMALLADLTILPALLHRFANTTAKQTTH
jgi:uncharacterized protein